MRTVRMTTLIAAIALMVFAAAPLRTYAQGTVYLRAVHFLTDAPNVDIYVDGKAVLTNLGYQDATTYTQLTPGKHVINFGVAGKTVGGPATDLTLDAAAGDLCTFVLSGTMASKVPNIYLTSESGLAKAANLTLDNTSMPLLFVQAVKDAGDVDVYVGDKKVGTAKSGDSMLAIIPYGPYTLKVTPAGKPDTILKDTAGIAMNNVLGVLGMTGTLDKLSLDYAYSAPSDAVTFLVAQKSLPVSFNALLKAVDAAKLGDTLVGPGPLTLFAPSDDAFAAVQPAGTVDKLEADPTLIGNVIKYHILGETVTFADIFTMVAGGTSKKTLNGQDMIIKIGDKGTIFGGTQATMLAYNIHTTNAVIHLINAVLMPPTN